MEPGLTAMPSLPRRQSDVRACRLRCRSFSFSTTGTTRTSSRTCSVLVPRHRGRDRYSVLSEAATDSTVISIGRASSRSGGIARLGTVGKPPAIAAARADCDKLAAMGRRQGAALAIVAAGLLAGCGGGGSKSDADPARRSGGSGSNFVPAEAVQQTPVPWCRGNHVATSLAVPMTVCWHRSRGVATRPRLTGAAGAAIFRWSSKYGHQRSPQSPSDPTRREILRLLRKRDLAAGEIADRFPLARSTLSSHFNVLKEAGLIVCERQGTSLVYSRNESVFEEALAALLELLSGEKRAAGTRKAVAR